MRASRTERNEREGERERNFSGGGSHERERHAALCARAAEHAGRQPRALSCSLSLSLARPSSATCRRARASTTETLDARASRFASLCNIVLSHETHIVVLLFIRALLSYNRSRSLTKIAGVSSQTGFPQNNSSRASRAPRSLSHLFSPSCCASLAGLFPSVCVLLTEESAAVYLALCRETVL